MSKRRQRDLNIAERCVVEIIWFACWIVGIMPHVVLYYIIAPIIKFVLLYIIKYRRKVVDDNLAASFPERDIAELVTIRNNFYTVLSEVFVSTIAMSHRSSYKRVCSIAENSELTGNLNAMEHVLDDTSWVALTAHFGLWEYLVVWSHVTNQRLMAVYHPLENLIFDELLRRLRCHKKVVPMPAIETIRFAVKNGDKYLNESYVLGLIADQNPPYLPGSNWYSFLGRDTIFFEGGEKIALRVGLPVYFVYQQRLAPGRYELRMRPIWDGKESIEPTVITRRYIEHLERAIRETPSMWLWSHRRWKASREKLPSGSAAKSSVSSQNSK